MTAAAASAAEVLAFWFGSADQVDTRWFKGGEPFDDEIRARFCTTIEAALSGGLDGWAADAGTPAQPGPALALILVLDQFTRNVFRGTPRAFAGDAQALAVALEMLDTDAARGWPPLARWFALMPLEHAESLAPQQRCVAAFEHLLADTRAAASPHGAAIEGALHYAVQHRDVIARFGRFPHRNAILGRADTAEEAAFLQQPGSRF
jgi:uncharacterized protein (DUF924 family)